MEVIRVVVIGAPQVGKSTVVQQFVQGATPERRPAAVTGGCLRRTYFPAVLLNSRLFAFRLHDVSGMRRFPVSADQEWTWCRAAGLRSAAAYLLVFDLSCPDSFRYIGAVRQQLLEARGGDLHRVPVVVVANKRDRVHETRHHRHISATVRKQWKWPYVECSAKFNYGVLQVFKELTLALDALGQAEQSEMDSADQAAGPPERTGCARCVVM